MQAVCFDFDGTLVDSEVFHAGNWSEYLGSLGVDFSAADFLREYAGVPWVKVATALVQQFSLSVEAAVIVTDMEQLTHKAILEKGIPAKEGAVDLLKHLHGELPLAVVTGAPRVYVEGILAHYGWLDYFDHVFCGEDVKQNKPAPDIYQLACHTLGLASSQVVAIEDSLTGAQSANSAGLRLVVVNDIHPVGESLTPYCYRTLKDAYSEQTDWLVA
ncbi:HAD family phosphatase [Photobacterium sanctipauli]|uniref:HAD family phosphatase n=1 Tax=Photobacterium sanctipauli TaxID=1342794 RepID=A0A2T3NY98_9GAMM|nr:HAD family phosphatase [Photobacterium sanctipauli]PSW21265.1 HAD family phosphatase [Photobacterium sanctipauli]